MGMYMKKPFNSYIDDNSLEKLNEDLIWEPKRKQEHKQRLLETIDQLESSQPVRSKKKSIFYKTKSSFKKCCILWYCPFSFERCIH